MKYLLVCIFTIVSYADISLVATPSCHFDTLDAKMVKRLFMKKTTQYQGEVVKVYDNRELYNDFIQTFIKKTPTKMNIYWTRMIFTGTKKPPRKVTGNDLLSLSKESDICHLSYTTQPIQGWKEIHVH